MHGKIVLERGKKYSGLEGRGAICWVTCVGTGSANGGTDQVLGTAGIGFWKEGVPALHFPKYKIQIDFFYETLFDFNKWML